MSVTIYHNPRCSKSRQTLALLRSHEVEPEIIHYLETPPSEEELERILRLLDREPRDLMRKKEAPYAALGLDDPALDRRALIRAMVDNPILIERPVVVTETAAAVGRPPQDVLQIL